MASVQNGDFHGIASQRSVSTPYSYQEETSFWDEVAEWLRRWTANPLCSARVGSNPILVGLGLLFKNEDLNVIVNSSLVRDFKFNYEPNSHLLLSAWFQHIKSYYALFGF